MIIGPCEAKQPMAIAGMWQLCGLKATKRHVYMCVHEHRKEGSTCSEHHPAPGSVGCSICWDLGHDCPMDAAEIAQ